MSLKKKWKRKINPLPNSKTKKANLNKQFEVRRAAVQAKAAEIAAMEAEMKKRLEAAQAPADDSETTEVVAGSGVYDRDAARIRAAGRRKKAPRRGFVSREKTPADFDQPIRVL